MCYFLARLVKLSLANFCHSTNHELQALLVKLLASKTFVVHGTSVKLEHTCMNLQTGKIPYYGGD